MNFDSEWLLQHLEGAPDVDTVAERLTDCGCLVELREPGDGAEIWDVEVTTNRFSMTKHMLSITRKLSTFLMLIV